MNLNDQPEGDNLVQIGDYQPREAERLLDALAREHIKFEIECDDGARFAAHVMGYFGDKAQIRVWIDPKDTERVWKIQAELFPEPR